MPYKDKAKQKHFQKVWKRKQNIRYRDDAITLLGGKCTDCGMEDRRVLQFDHIVPILRSGTDLNKQSGTATVRNVLRGDKMVCLRCANCHMIKTYEDRKTFKNWIE